MNQQPLVIHDFFTFPGGGERVVMELASSFGADIWTGQFRSDAFPEGYLGMVNLVDLNAPDLSPTWLKFSQIAQYWWIFAQIPFQESPWTIFSGSLSLLAHDRIMGPKLLYCHTPPRIIYDLKRYYLHQVSPAALPGFKILTVLYRRAYEKALRAMDCVVVNSLTVQKRLKQFTGMDSQVVYPPCNTEGFHWEGQEDYYISTARLDPLKRVDLVVRAFLTMPDKKLIIISGGSDQSNIKMLAENASNISVLGWVSEQLLRKLVGRCIATLYLPCDEDFGISPVESMAAGKPVIGVAEGGLLETVIPGRTGVLLSPPPGVDALVDAVQKMDGQRALEMRHDCEMQARQFDRRIFLDKMRSIMSQWVAMGSNL
jgi:glycosyltransferase involved in cell wall biosynthesis